MTRTSKHPWKIGLAALALIVSCSAVYGCGGSGSAQGGGSGGGAEEAEASGNYNETKSMVLDILHTKEGMDALKDIVRDPTFKQSLAINEADVQLAMVKALTDGSAHLTLQEQMKNPKFATALAKSFQKDNEKMLKELMKDPEYQEMMLTLLKSPEFSKNLYDLMKTPDYRKQTMTIMTQALQNPEFRLMFMELIKEAIAQGASERTPNEKKMSGQESGGQEDQQKKQEGGEDEQKKKEEGGGDEGGGGGG
ncbi:MAG TPA: spore germination lipoprotein GerD [Bacilli bacterium]|nr:spore germination lipoprotein GerD [Bacilli bacterium]